MTLITEIGVLLAFGAGLFVIFIFGNLLAKPLKIIGKLILNSIIGGALLVLINLIGPAIGIGVPVNIINAFIVGVLGLPGLVGLIILFGIS